MKIADPSKPHARKDELLIQELPDELLIYDLKRHQAHCLNRTAALVWKNCDGQATAAEIARSLETELQTPVGEELVWFALEQLEKFHLLEERITRPAEAKRVSRREAMRRVGAMAVVMLPAITAIVAPTAAQAVSCLPSNAACTAGAQCCSGVCRNNGTCL